jgi:RNA polymerase sigma-70 factor (ECF subfamily)
MGFENRYEGIDPYAVQIMRHKAKRLVGQAGFIESDRQDLEQELMMDLLHRLPKYNPDRAQRNTFIARVVEHKVATIIEARKAALRDYRDRLGDCSLDDRLEEKEGGSVERSETIDQEDYLFRTGRLSRPLSELRDMAIDTRKALDALSPELRDFCERLQTETATEIAQKKGAHRGNLYESLKKVRRFFEDAGLKKYF